MAKDTGDSQASILFGVTTAQFIQVHVYSVVSSSSVNHWIANSTVMVRGALVYGNCAVPLQQLLSDNAIAV